jgi:hypothetical protein
MRIFGLVLGGVLVAASSALAQVSSIQVIEAPPTNTNLGPRTLNAAIVACTDLPTATVPTPALRVLAAQVGDDHTAFGPGEVVVLNGGSPQGAKVGARYFTRRLQLGLNAQPPSALDLGAVRTTGWITVVAADQGFALARVDYACDNVAAGDYLVPYNEPSLPADAAPDGPPKFADWNAEQYRWESANLGKVLFGADRRQTFGAGDVTNIDRGSSHGYGVGTRIGFYRDRQNSTPLVEVGAGVVVETTADTSKVVITRAREAVIRGDYVVIRGTAVAPKN